MTISEMQEKLAALQTQAAKAEGEIAAIEQQLRDLGCPTKNVTKWIAAKEKERDELIEEISTKLADFEDRWGSLLPKR